jgi:hypothetical protein
VIGSHSHYLKFDDYGDAEGFRQHAAGLRDELARDKE